jgi:hypothetical protein
MYTSEFGEMRFITYTANGGLSMGFGSRDSIFYIFLLAISFTLVACSPFSIDNLTLSEQENDEVGEGLIIITRESNLVLACEEGSLPLVSDQEIYPVPNLEEPEIRIPFRDPTFHTCIVRVTDAKTDLSLDDPSKGMKNEYSRVQAFNADGSLFLVRSTEAYWYLYDANTLERLIQIPIEDEPRWDAVDPHLLYYFDETQLRSLDVSRGQNRIVHDFAEDFPDHNLSTVWTRYEGSPSLDGRYWGLMAQDQNWDAVTLLTYDLHEDQVLAVRELEGEVSIDSVTISPHGTYLLAYYDSYCEPGQLGDQDRPCGLMVYDRDLIRGRSVVPIIGHSDTALDGSGREVVVFQDIREDEISFVDLESGEIKTLFPIDFQHSPIGFHFSGRATDKPGWILISTYSGAQPSATWMDDGVFAVELAPGSRILRLAHTHSVVDEDQEHDYWAEPQASVNHDFTRVVFTSNWGRSGTDQIEMYMILLPASALADQP